jgi:L-threonylcarbamoyladenylate synthase
MMRVLPARGGLAAKDLSGVLATLQAGLPVALPTETVYGLAAPALQPTACEKIFHCKGRPLTDPLICHVPNRAWVTLLAEIPTSIQPQVDALIAAFWPGPLTLVLPRSPIVPDVVTSGQPTVALRQSAHPVFRQIVEALDEPLAAPSANRFGRISPTQVEHVVAELGEVVTLAVDGGPCSHGLESTILSVTADGGRILRPGPILPDDLAQIIPLLPTGQPSSELDAPIVPGNLA